MDTSYYLYAGYAIFWLLPMLYVFRLVSRVASLEKRLDQAITALES